MQGFPKVIRTMFPLHVKRRITAAGSCKFNGDLTFSDKDKLHVVTKPAVTKLRNILQPE
jgi:hydroxyacyl-ACP dehydratase HTD2-like protein with hotdog domain